MIQSTSSNKVPYRSDVDGLRAIAVLSVLAYHFSNGRIKGGFVGVDIFFVISGFLISAIIYNELESGSFSISRFYGRRIRRIYPALFIVLSAVCVAGWFLLLPSGFVVLGKQVLGGSTFSANFVLWSQSGYFSPDAEEKPLLHLWSLGVEEQYYLIFPLICVAFYRVRQRWMLPVLFLIIAIASMAVNVLLVLRYSAATFFLPFSRFWELFLGAGLSLCLQRNAHIAWQTQLSKQWKTGVGFLGLALLIISIFGIDANDPYPGWWALLPTIGTALTIAAGPDSWSNRYILSCKPAVLVGLISYPLYLWHWPILSFLSIATRVWGFDVSHLLKGAMIAVAFVLAYLTYRLIELPIRQLKQVDKRRRCALWLLGSVSLTGVFGLVVIRANGFPQRLPSAVVALDHDYEPEISRAWREGTCFLRPDQSAGAFAANCLDATPGEAGHPLVLVWGDSHAADLVPGFRALQRQTGVRLAQYTASLCAPIVGLHVRERPACFSINNAILNQIRSLEPDIVVLSAQWDNVGVDHHSVLDPDELIHTVKLVKAAGVKRVVVVGSAPSWTSALPGLLVDQIEHNPRNPVPHRLTRGLLAPHDDTLLKETAERAGAVYLPVFERLCDRSSCIATTGPTWSDVVAYDNAHFTEHGSVLVAQRIWADIEPFKSSASPIEN
jgi:peptidoglycan/LPS O-acetylase OafA/YrhL